MNTAKNKIIRNSDNEFLQPLGGNGFCIGHVDEVNGEGAREINEFKPTQHELLELAKYWMRIYLDDYFFCFIYDQSGSIEIRRMPYAMRRINRIADVLGEEIVNKTIDEAEEEFSKSVDPTAWKAFREHDTETRDKLLQDIYDNIDRREGQKLS